MSNSDIIYQEPLLPTLKKPPQKSSLCFILGLIAFGQLNRIFNATVGATDKILGNHSLLFSACTMFISYMIFCFASCFQRGQIPANVKTPPLYFFCICGFFSTAAFASNLYAYKLTTNTNAALMQIFGIIVASCFSQILFNVRYRWLHYLGMLFAACGLVIAVLPELLSKSNKLSAQMLVGDAFAIASATFVAIENVLQQKVLREGVPPAAYVARISPFSAVYSILVFFVTQEYKLMFDYEGDWSYLLYELPLIVFILLFLSSSILFVQCYGATVLNINSLCGVFYSMLFDIFLFNSAFQKEVAIGYALVIIGVVLFHLKHPRRKLKYSREFSIDFTQI